MFYRKTCLSINLMRNVLSHSLSKCCVNPGLFNHDLNLIRCRGIVEKQNKFYSSLVNSYIARDEKSDFDSVLPELIRDLTEASKSSDIPEIREWFSKVLHYNVVGGKNIRGLNVVFSYKLLSDDITAENIKLSYVLGWCVEMLQGFFIVIDDIQDRSELRRGLPAWYKREEVGEASAINDGLLIESGIYKILKMYFREKAYYLDLIELFHDTTLKTLYGQGLDLMTSKFDTNQKRDYSQFTLQRYNTIIKYKTGYYTFHLPVALALNMAGIKNQCIHDRCKKILLDIGNLFQIQDDFIDVYGDIEKTGKELGLDIKEGKCTWLAVNALHLADNKQLEIFRHNYGSADPVKKSKIIDLYNHLELPKLFKKLEDDANSKINKDIHNLEGVPHQIFTNLLSILFKRRC